MALGQSTEIGSIHYDLDLDDSDFNSKLGKASKSAENFSDSQKDLVDQGKNVGKGMLALAGVISGSVVSALFKAGSQFESFEASFETMLGSADQAKALMRDIGNFASKTPFELPQVVEGTKRLLAYGTAANEVIGQFKVLGDIAAGVGTDKLPQLITAFGQVQAKGKLMGQELLQFTEAGVNLGGELQKMLGVSRAELEKMISEGKIGFGQVQQALANLTSKGGLFFNAMERQSRTFNGAVSNLRDSITIMTATIGMAVGKALGPYVAKVSEFIGNHKELIIAISATGVAITVFAAGIFALIKGVMAARAALIALQASSLPLVAALTTIGALLGVVVFRASERFAKQAFQTTKTVVEGSKSIGNTAQKELGGKATKAADDLRKKLSEIDDQINETKREFGERLAEMIRDSQQKVTELKSQIDSEKADFAGAESEKKKQFERSQEDMKTAHSRKVADIVADIEHEKAKGIEASSERLADLQRKLDEENADYQLHFSRLEEDYKTDSQKAKQEHDKKLSDLQTKLTAEQEMLNRHKDSVLATQDTQFRDEIQKLKDSHVSKLAEFEKQKQDAIIKSRETTTGMAESFNKLPEMINDNMLDTVGKDMGTSMGSQMYKGLKNTFLDELGNIGDDIAKSIGKLADRVAKALPARDNAMTRGFEDLLLRILPSSFFRASGGPVASGNPYIVGEKGPELFVPGQSGNIIPNGSFGGGGSGGAVVNIDVGLFAGTPQELRTIAEKFQMEINRLNTSRGMA